METEQVAVKTKARIILIGYIVAENVCLSEDDKALVSVGQLVLWKILLQIIFQSGRETFVRK
tara:strand:- start:193 stop:378 length:186 start_codon:yes stop_codon:yes gene_type:complete